jgi:hypothetical protein
MIFFMLFLYLDSFFLVLIVEEIVIYRPIMAKLDALVIRELYITCNIAT